MGAGLASPRLLGAEKTDTAKALGLKITGLRTFVINTGADSDENYVFVKICTSKGITGLGEDTMTGKGRTVAAAIEEHERYLEDLDELAHLRAHTNVPLATGERICTKYPFAEICARHLVDYVQPDLVHCGGFTEVKKIAALAEAFRIELTPHNPNSRVCTFASVHLCMSTPCATVLETSTSELPRWDDLFHGGRIEYKDGFALPPQRPGLGLELNEKEAAKHPYQPKPWSSLHFADSAIHDR